MTPSNLASSRPVTAGGTDLRSEEHTSELQSQSNLVCRLLLEKIASRNDAPHRSHRSVPLLFRLVSSLPQPQSCHSLLRCNRCLHPNRFPVLAAHDSQLPRHTS